MIVVILGFNVNHNSIHLSSFWAPVQRQQLSLGDMTEFNDQYITIVFGIKQFKKKNNTSICIFSWWLKRECAEKGGMSIYTIMDNLYFISTFKEHIHNIMAKL